MGGCSQRPGRRGESCDVEMERSIRNYCAGVNKGAERGRDEARVAVGNCCWGVAMVCGGGGGKGGRDGESCLRSKYSVPRRE